MAYPDNNETSQFTEPVYDEAGVPFQEKTSPDVPAATPVAPEPVLDHSKSDDLVKKMFAIRQPDPTPDNERLNRISRMGKANTIARGVNVLGDILSLSTGANVNKAQPDTQTSDLMRQYQVTLDKYKNDTDNYKLRNYAQDREDAKFGITYEMRKEAQALQEAQLKARTAEAKARSQQDWNKFVLGLDQKQQDRLFKADENKKNRAVQIERNNIAKNKADKSASKPFTQISVDGKDTPLSEAQHHNMYDEAVNHYGQESDYIKGVTAQYQNNTKLGQQEIIQHYVNEMSKKRAEQTAANNPFIPDNDSHAMAPLAKGVQPNATQLKQGIGLPKGYQWEQKTPTTPAPATPPVSQPATAPTKGYDPSRFLSKTKR